MNSADDPTRPLRLSGVTCRLGGAAVLDDVSLSAGRGEIHALLGPTGAGKTTLLRVLAGLIEPGEGHVRIAGAADGTRGAGLLPSGDRTFYLRLSGLENLLFFARLHGMTRRRARLRAEHLLERVDLAHAARRRAGLYSHGMIKRLGIARALLAEPPVLLLDEATHDLDPEGAARIRGIVTDAARAGATIIWATQRLDELRGFADRVTLVVAGRVRFSGSLPDLVARAVVRRYVLRVRNGHADPAAVRARLAGSLTGLASIEQERPGDAEHFVLSLADGAVLGDVLGAVNSARFVIEAVREHRSDIEEAFLGLTRRQP